MGWVIILFYPPIIWPRNCLKSMIGYLGFLSVLQIAVEDLPGKEPIFQGMQCGLMMRERISFW